jgi:hypothetical protein
MSPDPQSGPVIATDDRIVHDKALGIDRKVLAGQPVPPELVDAYNDDGGETKPDNGQPSLVTGLQTTEPVIATDDRIVHDEALGINRKVFAGQQVPPELVGAYQEAGGDIASSSPADAAGRGEPASDNYDDLDKEALEAEAEGRDLTVEGTGKDGNVLVDDLRKALRADDAGKES